MADATTTPKPVPGKAARAATILGRLTLGLGVACVIAGVVSGLGARLDLWHFRIGFLILRWCTYTASAVILLSLIGAILAHRLDLRPARTASLLGLALGVIAAGPPLYQFYLATHVPAIHDISTDTANPPQFAAVLALRKKDDNSLEPNAETAALQASAFPDLQPMLLTAAPQQALRRAEQVARAMGWEIVAVDPQAMCIEATATTLLFGFKDDIAIRVTPQPTGGGSRIDVRSASRVGRSDLGVNARRIRAFLKELGSSA